MSTHGPKLLVDTNVWIDAFVESRADHANARALFDFALLNDLSLLYAATSMQNVHYLISQALKRAALSSGRELAETDYKEIADAAWRRIDDMSEVGFAVGCDESDLWLARKHRTIHYDFEDGLMVAAAKRSEADFIVTRDKQFLAHCPVAALDTFDMLDYLQKTL